MKVPDSFKARAHESAPASVNKIARMESLGKQQKALRIFNMVPNQRSLYEAEEYSRRDRSLWSRLRSAVPSRDRREPLCIFTV
jgi:hypothetical protein